VTDIRAAQEEQEFCDTRQIVLDEVQVQHRIAYNLNLRNTHKKGSVKTLSIAMRKTVCEYFGVRTDRFHARRKVQYLSVLTELVKGCSCFSE